MSLLHLVEQQTKQVHLAERVTETLAEAALKVPAMAAAAVVRAV
jgi:hypothetical protein